MLLCVFFVNIFVVIGVVFFFLCKMFWYDDCYRGSDRCDDWGGGGGGYCGGGGGGRGVDIGFDVGVICLYVGCFFIWIRSWDLEDFFVKYGRYEYYYLICVRLMKRFVG